MTHAQARSTPSEYYEKHHILPTSMGGGNEPSNIVCLTLKEHLAAHLLLAVAGNENQWGSVSAIVQDRLNKNRPHRFGKIELKITRFIRRNMANYFAIQCRRKQRQQEMNND